MSDIPVAVSIGAQYQLLNDIRFALEDALIEAENVLSLAAAVETALDYECAGGKVFVGALVILRNTMGTHIATLNAIYKAAAMACE